VWFKPPVVTPVLQALPKLAEVQAAMTRYFASQSSRAGLGLELLPGVQQLLETLKVRPTLLTWQPPSQPNRSTAAAVFGSPAEQA
jgi:hypothetical protein